MIRDARLWSGAVALFALTAQGATGLTLEELQKELRNHPDAAWTAGPTEAATTYRPGDAGGPFGLAAGALDADLVIEPEVFDTPSWMSARIDWRDKDGQDWMTPVRNQGRCGSCVAFAAVAALEGQYNIASRNAALDIDLSEQDLFGRIGQCANGSWPSTAVSVMTSTGVPDEACYQYVSGRLGNDAPTSGTCSNRAERAIKIASGRSVGASGVKAALANGPVMTTMTVYEDFMFYTGGIYKRVSGASVGGHAVTIVGYDDVGRYFIVKNSWGTDWGENGYFRVSYDDRSGVGQSNHALTLQTPRTHVKLETPVHLEALAGAVELRSAPTQQSPIRSTSWQLIPKGRTQPAAQGALDRSFSGTLDTTGVADGVYDIRLTATLENGTQGLPWYTTVSIANDPQPVSVRLVADFDASRPVKDRVYFKLQTTHGAVPLTSIDVTFTKDDGTVSRTVAADDPGRESKVGWRTGSFPNGTYRVSAVGRIGELQSFASNELTVTVRN